MENCALMIDIFFIRYKDIVLNLETQKKILILINIRIHSSI